MRSVANDIHPHLQCQPSEILDDEKNISLEDSNNGVVVAEKFPRSHATEEIPKWWQLASKKQARITPKPVPRKMKKDMSKSEKVKHKRELTAYFCATSSGGS